MKYSKEYRKIKKNYYSLSWAERFILWSRFQITPIQQLLKFIPQEGDLLDLGCGFGAFSYFFAFLYPRLKVTAIDPSKNRIDIAHHVCLKPDNLKFRVAEIDKMEEGYFDAIVTIDVICLLSFGKQDELFKLCYRALKPGGLFIIKTMNKDHFLKISFLTLNHIFFMYIVYFFRFLFCFSSKIQNLLKRASGNRSRIYNYSYSHRLKTKLERFGFHVAIHDISLRLMPYPSVIFVCQK